MCKSPFVTRRKQKWHQWDLKLATLGYKSGAPPLPARRKSKKETPYPDRLLLLLVVCDPLLVLHVRLARRRSVHVVKLRNTFSTKNKTLITTKEGNIRMKSKTLLVHSWDERAGGWRNINERAQHITHNKFSFRMNKAGTLNEILVGTVDSPKLVSKVSNRIPPERLWCAPILSTIYDQESG